MTKFKILAFVLAIGIAGGALAGCSNSTPNANQTAAQPANQDLNGTANANLPEQATTNANAGNLEQQQQANEAGRQRTDSAYREGYREGAESKRNHIASAAPADNGKRQTYYDYNRAPQHRSFWQKHRDKTTVAAGAGTGALLGALIGGGKGAGIGAIAGGAGSALYTYKLRKKNQNNDQ